jgi:hypothetical protein
MQIASGQRRVSADDVKLHPKIGLTVIRVDIAQRPLSIDIEPGMADVGGISPLAFPRGRPTLCPALIVCL